MSELEKQKWSLGEIQIRRFKLIMPVCIIHASEVKG